MRQMTIKNTAVDPVYDLTSLVKSLEAEGGVGSLSIVPIPGSKDILVIYSNASGV